MRVWLERPKAAARGALAFMVVASLGLTAQSPELRRLVRAGFADRILFGSDGPLAEGVAAILEADFLTEQQQRDILCGNAARFLRLGEATCQ